jgi:hypothetical protein
MNTITPIKEKDFNTNELVFKQDGSIIHYTWDHGVNRVYLGEDVSDEIMFHLDREITVEKGVTLKQVFDLLVKNNPEILNVLFQDCFIKDFVEHYQKLDSNTFKDVANEPYSREKLDYLELYWVFNKNSTTKKFYGFNRPQFHGVGVELLEDCYEYGNLLYKKGKRIQFAIEFSPLNTLINLPIILNTEALVYEDDYSVGDGVIEKLQVEYTLRNLISGIFWELSFCGTPEEVNEHKQELDSISLSVKLDSELPEKTNKEIKTKI